MPLTRTTLPNIHLDQLGYLDGLKNIYKFMSLLYLIIIKIYLKKLINMIFTMVFYIFNNQLNKF